MVLPPPLVALLATGDDPPAASSPSLAPPPMLIVVLYLPLRRVLPLPAREKGVGRSASSSEMSGAPAAARREERLWNKTNVR